MIVVVGCVQSWSLKVLVVDLTTDLAVLLMFVGFMVVKNWSQQSWALPCFCIGATFCWNMVVIPRAKVASKVGVDDLSVDDQTQDGHPNSQGCSFSFSHNQIVCCWSSFCLVDHAGPMGVEQFAWGCCSWRRRCWSLLGGWKLNCWSLANWLIWAWAIFEKLQRPQKKLVLGMKKLWLICFGKHWWFKLVIGENGLIDLSDHLLNVHGQLSFGFSMVPILFFFFFSCVLFVRLMKSTKKKFFFGKELCARSATLTVYVKKPIQNFRVEPKLFPNHFKSILEHKERFWKLFPFKKNSLARFSSFPLWRNYMHFINK